MQIKLDQFQGPLALLLELIQENELQISQVSLSEVADQFLDYLDNNPDISIENLANFLDIASCLISLKLKVLLPYLSPEEEENLEILEKQLKLYKEFQEAGQVIYNILKNQKQAFLRINKLEKKQGFYPPPNFDIEMLKQSYLKILNNLQEISIPQKIIKKSVNIKKRFAQIRNRLAEIREIYFSELTREIVEKNIKLVYFSAVLEMARREELSLEQREMFGEIRLKIFN